MNDNQQHVKWFRDSSPYINAHRGKTFVLMFGGEAVENANFANIIHDIALLNSLGVKLVLVHGARPQISARLAEPGIESTFEQHMRITDSAALLCCASTLPCGRDFTTFGLLNTMPCARAMVRNTSPVYSAGLRTGNQRDPPLPKAALATVH